MNLFVKAAGALAGVLLSAAAVAEYHSSSTVRIGAPGVAMQVTETNQRLEDRLAANVVPPPIPAASSDGTLAVDAYKNVQVMGHISAGQFTRLMTAMTTWVAPVQGCAYCHAPQRDASGNVMKDEDGYVLADSKNMQSDELYTKRVARRMLQMTLHLNGDWKAHVKQTGVTCYTCHRGQPVPSNIWFEEPPNPHDEAMMGAKIGQNAPAPNVGLASLPSGVFRPFLVDDEPIRVIGTEPLPHDNPASIKQAEWTYGLMMHMSNSLGVNCTYCHNTRAFAQWDTSPPARAQAWYGIRMVRDLNNAYLVPLTSQFPPSRLGTLGDAPKVNCATCHQHAFKPLLGVSMLGDYAVLAEAKPQPQKKVVMEPASGSDGDGGAPAGTMDGGASPSSAATGDAGRPSPALSVDAGAPGAAPRRKSAPLTDAGR